MSGCETKEISEGGGLLIPSSVKSSLLQTETASVDCSFSKSTKSNKSKSTRSFSESGSSKSASTIALESQFKISILSSGIVTGVASCSLFLEIDGWLVVVRTSASEDSDLLIGLLRS